MTEYNIWIVTEGVAYEGATPIGVFSTRDKAYDFMIEKHRDYDYYEIIPMKLDHGEIIDHWMEKDGLTEYYSKSELGEIKVKDL